MKLFIVIIVLLIQNSIEEDCKALHAQAHGVNLVCCDLNNTLISSCEFSSLCKEYCSCFLTISRDLSCNTGKAVTTFDYKWMDHQPNSSPLDCSRPNLPNLESPYSIVVEGSDPILTRLFLLGSCNLNVTSITFQNYDQLYDSIDFSRCFPSLASFQVVLLQRTKADFSKSLKNLKNLDTLSLVNVDFEFWLHISPFVHSLTYLHVENSSITEIPKWFAESSSLSTVYLKNTRVGSLASLAQLPAVRSLKLSHNILEHIHQHIFVSPLLIHADFSFNKINSISSHTFSKCVDLRVLDLSSNPIKMLPYKPFAKNTRLKWLKLSRTNITTLSPDNFYGLSSLKTLTLSRTPLQNISPYTFVPLKALRYLDLDSCNLTRIPQAITFSCHLTRLNVANNLLHRSSSFPPEVLAVLSGLAQIRIDGNPLTEFPPSFLLISRDNTRLLRHLLHSTMTLPLWVSEPCTPYYWAMHMTNRTTTLKGFLTQYDDKKMNKNGLFYCKEQFEWMNEQTDIYKELDKNSGCSTQRRLRSSIHHYRSHSSTPSDPPSNCSSSSASLPPPPPSISRHSYFQFHGFKPIPQIFIASICTNFLLIFILLTCIFIGCTYDKKEQQ